MLGWLLLYWMVSFIFRTILEKKFRSGDHGLDVLPCEWALSKCALSQEKTARVIT